MASNGLVRVRMRRHVAPYVQVLELEMGEVYELTPDMAAQFIQNDMADPVDGKKGAALEAAALAPASRRG